MSHNNTQTKNRLLKISILRYNPADPASVPHMQTFELEESASMTLFIALNEIRDKQDPSLQFDFVCRAGICGSCAMMINGKPGLACRTLTRDLPTEFTLAPLPAFELIGDLSVNTGKWMRNMSERMETWVHLKDIQSCCNCPPMLKEKTSVGRFEFPGFFFRYGICAQRNK